MPSRRQKRQAKKKQSLRRDRAAFISDATAIIDSTREAKEEKNVESDDVDEKDPSIAMLQARLEHSRTIRKTAIADARGGADFNVKEVSLSPKLPDDVTEALFILVGREIPLDILRDDIAWKGHPGISAENRERIPEKLTQLRNEYLLALMHAFMSPDVGATRKAIADMTKKLYQIVPQKEYDVVLNATETAKYHKRFAEEMKMEEYRLERVICANITCGKIVQTNKRCACRSVAYCNEDCQRAHRDLHREECRRLMHLQDHADKSPDAWFVEHHSDGSKSVPIWRELRMLLEKNKDKLASVDPKTPLLDFLSSL